MGTVTEGRTPSVPPPPFAGVIGTAGHVDHGKTTLVRALTGVDTDRLPEEKRRGISIELGFAELVLPSGRHAGMVDVPGHERFVRHMVAGASGIDLALLVVAADEGIMPQTREHLEITLLLGVRRAVVALTKADLVEPEWLDLVREDVRLLLAGTPLGGAVQIPVAAPAGVGLAALLAALDAALPAQAARPADGFVRLPLDRAFSVPGFGTVVTGTLAGGTVAAQDRLELLPPGIGVRVRGLQVHGHPVEHAAAGQRVAVNLSGVQRADVQRGAVLATPGTLAAHDLLAARVDALPGRTLEHGQRLHVHVGTGEAVGRLTLLEGAALSGGGSGLALLRLERPLVAGRGDRFILRQYSPVTTLGGGRVLDTGRRYRRHRADDLDALERAERGDPGELLLAALAQPAPQALAAAAGHAGLSGEQAAQAIGLLRQGGRVVVLEGWGEGAHFQAADQWERLCARVGAALAAYHQAHPLRLGMPRELLRQQALGQAEPRAAAAAVRRLGEEGLIRVEGELVALAGHVAQLPAAAGAQAERVVARLRAAGFAPPPVAEVLAGEGVAPDPEGQAELLVHLVATGRLVRADAQLYFAAEVAAEAADRVRAYLREHGTMSVAELRDLFGVTRKHAVPLAEYLDGIRVTRREGDVRRLA